MAARQHGRLSLGQLSVLGLTRQAVHKRVRSGRLRREWPGVYVLPAAPDTLDALRMGAVMACGNDASLSHVSVLRAAGLLDGRDGPPWHVTTPHGRGGGLDGIAAHEATLHPRDITRRNHVPMTTIARALLDAAPTLPARRLQLAVDRAAQRGLLDEIGALAARTRGHRGLKPLGAALARALADADRAKGDFELRLRRLLADVEVEQPLSNLPVGGYEVDLVWPAFRVIVEADGFGTHGRAERDRFEDDRRRTADLQALGFVVLRFTWRQLDEDPAWVLARITGALAAAAVGPGADGRARYNS